jgi:hypothetical protein
MKSELQFFMKDNNEEEFFALFSGRCESTINNSFFYELWIGLNFIQFCPSKTYGNQLTSGRIAYMTIDSNDDRAEILYKEMRKYIKKNYHNKMRIASNTASVGRLCNDLYFTNEVANWVFEKSDNKLVQAKDSFVYFIPVTS